jgi:hypothetical protein
MAGKLGPEKLNPLPITITCEIVKFDLLLLLTVIGTELMFPT